MSINVLTIEGRLGTEPEVKVFGENRLTTCRFAVRRYNPKNKDEPFTDWYTLNAWGFAGDQLERLSKGEMAVVSGQLELKEYTTKTGDERIDTSIYVREVFGPKKWVEKGEAKEKDSPAPKKDDLPF